MDVCPTCDEDFDENLRGNDSLECLICEISYHTTCVLSEVEQPVLKKANWSWTCDNCVTFRRPFTSALSNIGKMSSAIRDLEMKFDEQMKINSEINQQLAALKLNAITSSSSTSHTQGK